MKIKLLVDTYPGMKPEDAYVRTDNGAFQGPPHKGFTRYRFEIDIPENEIIELGTVEVKKAE